MWRTGVNAEDIKELRKTADLSLRETKEIDRAIGRSMAALVVVERHLWLHKHQQHPQTGQKAKAGHPGGGPCHGL